MSDIDNVLKNDNKGKKTKIRLNSAIIVPIAWYSPKMRTLDLVSWSKTTTRVREGSIRKILSSQIKAKIEMKP